MVELTELGAELRRRRERKRMTQEELADRIGTSRVTITAYEAGRMSMPVTRLFDIAGALGVRASTLLASLDAVRTARMKRALAERSAR